MSNAVATVAFLQGKAWAKSPDGELRPLTVGSVLNANDILVTGLNARIELDTGELQRLVVQGGQEVAMNRDLNAETATGSEEAMLTDASVQEALTILEQGGDLLEELEETAAGNTGGTGGSSHGFVQLTRLIEQVDPLAFDFDAATAGSAVIPSTDTELPRNNPPEVVDQQLAFDEDTVLTGQIIATDVENDTLIYAVSTPPVNGVLILDSVTGSFTFTPNTNFNGIDSFVVSVTDSAGNSVNNIISLTINPVNDAPVSSAQPLVTNEDTPVTGQIVATDVENDVLSFAVSTNPANGVVTINAATGAYEYTPNTNFYGVDSFVVTVSDSNGGVSSSTVNVTINSVNDVPVATNQNLTTAEDTPINGQIVASDVDADPLTYTVTTNPTNGSLLFNANGSFTYTPNANYNGNDSFVVTVSDGQGGVTTSNISIGITPANDAPVTSNQTITTNEDTAYIGQIVATDVDADILTYSINTTPINGTLTLNQATGQFTYTPNTNYNGSDSFSVLVNDNNGGIVTSVVTVGVTAVNDSPVAQAASFTVAEDAAIINGSVVATDVDANAVLTYSLNNSAPAGLVFNANGSYSFDASNSAYQSLGVGQSVVLTIPYTVTDDQNATSTANLVITVTGTNDLPVAQAASFTVAEDAAIINGSVIATDVDANATLTYSLNNSAPAGLVFNSNGSYSFDASNTAYQSLGVGQSVVLTVPYTVTDDQNATSTENLVITVTGTNDAPIAQSVSFTVAEDAAIINGSVIATDVDANAVLTYSLNNSAPAGLTFNTNGSYSFDASNAAYQSLGVGQSTVLTVPYTVTDDQNATSTANLVITVTGTNDAPVAQAASFSVAEDAAVINGSVVATDVDANAVLTYSLNNAAPAGLVFNANGTYSFDASNSAYQSLGIGQSVVLTVPYTVTDDQNATSTENLVITVTGTNDAPTAQAASFTVAEEAAIINGSVVATDVDANAVLTYSLNNTAPAGLTFNSNGTYSFDASNTAYQSLGVGQSVVLTIPYTVTDDQNATSTANLVITVTGTNDAPIAQAVSFTVAEDAAIINGSVIATDVDANAVLTYSLNNSAPAGLTFNTNGSYSFDASNAAYQSLGVGQSTVLTVPYTVTDDQNATSTENLVITVIGTNDGPVANTDVSSTAINTAVVIDVRANDSDIDNAPTDLVVSNPQVDSAQGSVTLDAQGRVVFTPALNFSGVAIITYTLTDPAGAPSIGTVTVTVGANTAPTGTDNIITLNEDGSHTFTASDFGFADIDAAQTFNAVRIDALPAAGSLMWGGVAVTVGQIIPAASLSTLVFTPAADANGNNYANFTFSVQDSAGGFDLVQNTIQLNVTALNDAPVAQAAAFTVAEDAAIINGSVVATDIDANAVLTYSLNNTAPAGLVFNANGTYSFDASNSAYQSLGIGQSVVLTVPYTVTDDQNATSTENLVITVTGTNDAPVAQAASFTVAEDAAVITGNVTATDIDANAVLTYSLNNTAPAGLVFNANGTYSFDASNSAYQSLGVGQSVVLTVPYTVTDDQNATSTENLVITVTGTNDAPTAQAASFTVAEDAAIINGSVVATDVDANAVLTYSLNNMAPAGLTFNSNGTYSFDASNTAYQSLGVGQSVVLTVPYTVTDDQNATSTENLVITVTGTNDAPTAQVASFTVAEDAAIINGSVLATDIDANSTLTYSLNNAAPAGLVFNANGTYSFDASNAAYQSLGVGQQVVLTVPYTVTDDQNATSTANLVITVTGTNDGPVANTDVSSTPINTAVVIDVRANDSDVDNAQTDLVVSNPQVDATQGTVALDAQGRVVFTPALNFSGVANITYTLTDPAGLAAQGNVTVNVGANTAPTGTDNTITINEDGSHTFAATDFGFADADIAQTFNAVRIDSLPSAGSLTLGGIAVTAGQIISVASLGSLVFTPAQDANGNNYANFTFSVQDSASGFDLSPNTIQFNVTALNDAPVAQAASFTVAEDAAVVTGNLIATDIDVGAILTYTLNVAAPAGFTFNPDGSYSFDASNSAYQSLGVGQQVVLTVPYTVTDDQNATSTANLIITVTGTNDAPIAQTSSFTVAEDAAIVNGSVTATDTDANATLTYSLNNSAPAGLTFNTNGSYSFDASNAAYQSLGVGQSTVLTVPYTVTDDQNATSTANLVITVTGTNDAPIAQAAAFTVAEDAAVINGSVVATDVDENAVLTYSLNNAAPAGLVFNSNGSYSFDASNAAYQSLGVGQSVVLTIPYTVTDDQNATSTANFVITVTGTNDAPVAQATSFSVAEDAAVINGSVVATDVDANAVLTYSLNNAAPAGLIFNSNGSYSFDASNAAYQSLGVGQSVVLTVPYIVTDDQNATSTANLVITITGTNDAPVAQASSFSVAEDAAIINGSVIATDVDANATFTYSLNNSAPAGLVFNSNGSYSFDASNAAYQSLGVGQSVVLTVLYTVTDDQNSTSTENLVITVTGTNDVPVAQAAAFTVAEDAAIVNGSVTATDTDANANLTYALNNPAPAGLTFNTNGSYSFDASNAAYQSLGVGQSTVLTFPYTVTDDQNATSTANFVITVTGTNDAPVAQAASFSVAEDAAVINGSVVATDVDANAVLTYSLNNAAPAGLVFNSNGTYSFDASNAAYQSLGVSQQVVLTIPYTVTDDQNATSTANLVITVTGTNDAPVAQASSFSVAEDAAIINGSVIATDVDANATLTYSLNNSAPAGLVFNANGSYSFDASNLAYQSLGVGQSVVLTVPYTVTDDQNATSTANLIITITGTNDVPIAQTSSFTVAEDAAIVNGSVTATDTDANATLTYSLNNSAPAGLIFNSNGSYSFDATNTAYQSIGVGQQVVLTVPYTVTDDQSVTSTANLVITVTGTNDTPVAQAASFTVAEDAAIINGSVVATDVDANAVLTYSLNNAAPAGLIFNSNGSYSFDASNAAYQSLGVGQSVVLTVPYTVTDDQNATSTANLVITVTGTNDAPVAQAASFTVAEDAATINGSVVATDVDANAVLTYSLNNAAPAGLIFNSNGSYSFDASNAAYQSLGVGQSVVLTVPYTVTDDQNATSTANLVITVTGTNDAPIAQAQNFVGTEDNNVAVNLSGSDIDGSVQSIQLVSLPTVAQGVLYLADGITAVTTAMNLTVAQAANLIFSPATNFNGNVSFNFTVTDNNNGVSTPATIDIAIAAVNDAPVNTVPAAITMNEDTTQAITGLIISDLDSATGNLTVTLQITNGVLNVSGGSAVIANNGTNSVTLTGTQAEINSTLAATVNYVPTANFNGTSTLTIATNDNGNSGTGGALIDVDTVSITVDQVWDVIAPSYLVTGNEDTVINDSVGYWDSTTSGGLLTYQLLTDPTDGPFNGTVLFNSDGSYSYTPNPNFNGSDSFRYRVIDAASGESGDRSVGITVNPVNDMPTAQALNLTGDEDSNIVVNLTGSDIDAGDSIQSVQLVSLPLVTEGILYLSDGVTPVTTATVLTAVQASSLIFTPANNYVGNTSFSFTVIDTQGAVSLPANVSINLSSVNDAPVNTIPGVVTMNEDTTQAITGLSISDVDSATGNLTVTLQITNGILNVIGGSAVVANNGTNSVTLTGTQAEINSTLAATVNYVPTTNFYGISSLTMTTSDNGNSGSGGVLLDVDTVSITVDNLWDINAPSYTTSGDENTVINDNVGYWDSTTSGGALTYQLYIDPSDPKPSNGTVTFNSNGSYSYTPNLNFSGTDSFRYLVIDTAANESAIRNVGITVNPVDDSVVPNQIVATNEDTVLNGNLPTTDADGAVTYAVITNQATTHGTVSVAANGSYIYTPAANYSGNDSFVVNVTDSQNFTTPVTVSIVVNPVNDGSVANQIVSTNEDTVLNGNLPTTDADGAVTYAVITNQATTHGTVSVAANGSYIYTPNANYFGSDNFTVNVTDSQGFTTPVTVDITVNSVNDSPVNTLPAGWNTNEDTSVVLSGLSVSDVDSLAGVISVTLNVASGLLSATSAAGVTVTGSGSSSLQLSGSQSAINAFLASASAPVYQPAANVNGNINLTMTTNDGTQSDVDVSVIQIAPLNDNPVLQNESVSTNEDTGVTGNLLANDVDVDSTLTISNFTWNGTTYAAGTLASSSVGSLIVNSNGSYTFTPASNYTGSVPSVSYLVQQDGVNFGSANMSLSILAVNDAPVNNITTPTFSATEDTARSITGLSISDIDAASGNMTVTLAITNGTLAVSGGTASITGSGTTLVTLTGTMAAINSTLAATVTYNPAANFFGTARLTMTTRDGGNTGTGGQLQDVDVVTIQVSAAADPGERATANANTVNEGATVANASGNNADGQVLANDSGSSKAVTAVSYDGTSVNVTATTAGVITGQYGTLTLYRNGTYSYTANTAAAESLAATQQVVDVFTYNMTASAGTGSSTLTFTITGTNDLPIVSAGTKFVTGSEDSAYIFNWSQFGISDVDVSNSLQIRVPTLGFPTDGQLQFFNGTSWVALPTDPNLQNLTKANIDAGFFRFVPDANESGSDAFGGSGTGNMQSNYASFTYQGFDGTSVSTTATMVIDITPVVDDANVILGGAPIVDGSIVVPVPPTSEGLTVRVYSNLANVSPTGVDTAAEVSGLLELLNAAAPTSTSVSSAPQNYVAGSGSPSGINTDGAYRVTGLIYLEVGKTYTFSTYMDDSAVLRVGGTELLNQPYNNWGIKTANNFVPTANGYYSLDWVVYNGDGVGAFKPWLSVNGGTALELTAANYKLYSSIANLESAGGIHDTFVANGAGGFYPTTNSGVEDSYVELAPIVVSLADTDGSEILVSITANNLLAGTILTDGTNSFTATSSSTSINLSGWNLSTLQLRPPVNFSGNYTLTLDVVTRETATGVESSSTRSIVIEVAAVNDAPVAAADSASVIEDTLSMVTGNLTANDQDVDGDTLSIQSVNGLVTNVGSIVAGAYGQLVVQANGGYTYTLDTTNAQINALNTSETLRDIFTYRVTDPSGETSLASLVINIQGNTDSVTLSGTITNDNLSGSSANDVIEALAGNDFVDAGAGNDVIRLGGGDSTGKTFADIRNDPLMTQAEGAVSVTTANGTNVGLGGTGNDAIIGGDGYDLAYGGSDNDYLYGGASTDGLRGGAGADRIQGGSGSDVMRGDAGADVFVWTLGDQASTPGSLDAGAANPFGLNANIKVTENATDMIMDFSKSEGDVLDLRDLLQGESHLGTDPGDLTNYLHFETTNINGVQGTVVHVSAHGDFAAGYDVTKEDMTIILQNVNLTIDSNGATLLDDRAIIQDLLTNNRLITD